MHQVLVYSDSLTWGIIPNTRERLPFHKRWPGIVEQKLNRVGLHARMIEDALNGRRTVLEDPFKAGRNGLQGLSQRIEVNSPLALVILMLGANDFQAIHAHTQPWSAALGIAALVNEIRKAPIEPGMPVPPILIIAPPLLQTARGMMAQKFQGAEQRSVGLAEAYRQLASELQCHFFDAQTATTTSELDGVHFEASHHQQLAHALVEVVRPILATQPHLQ